METAPLPRAARAQKSTSDQNKRAPVSVGPQMLLGSVSPSAPLVSFGMVNGISGEDHRETPCILQCEMLPLAIGVLYPSNASPCEAHHGLVVLLKIVRCRGLSIVCSFCAALASSC